MVSGWVLVSVENLISLVCNVVSMISSSIVSNEISVSIVGCYIVFWWCSVGKFSVRFMLVNMFSSGIVVVSIFFSLK